MKILGNARLARVDWMIVGITIGLSGLGIMNLYSASNPELSPSHPPIYLKQALFFLIGLVFAGLVVTLDYRRWLEYAWIFYGTCLILLVSVLIFGKSVSGSQRWLDIGLMSFQPSELAKYVIILVQCRYFQENPNPRGYHTIRELLIPMGLIGVFCVLIMLEPDLGTTLLLVLISGSVILFAGLRFKSFFRVAMLIVVALPLIWWGLEDYQRGRIKTFLNPQNDPLGAGYHITQSKIAVGSGGLFGKGFRQGTQSHLHFLPEHHTDFAFSVWAEEWGFFGSIVLFTFFLFLLAYAMYVSYRADDLPGRLLAFGIAAYFFWPIVINIGMTLGIVPVVGSALPFISYGGSSLVTSLIAIGFLVNVRMRRFLF
jgi:rod shape determining protein RodA